MLSRILDANPVDCAPYAWRTALLRAKLPAAIPARGHDESPSQAPAAAHAAAELEVHNEALVRRAYERGFSEGCASAEARATALMDDAVRNLGTALAEVAQIRGQILRESEADLVKLSLGIARRVLHRELTIDANAVEGLIKVALRKVGEQGLCCVRVHPSHAAIIRDCLQREGGAAGIEILEDSSQQIGGAVFEMSDGKLDASIETQLREIECGLTDRFQGQTR